MASEEVQEEVKGVVSEEPETEEKAVTDVQDADLSERDLEATEEIKQVTEELPEPDSWEDVDALEERLKTLTTADSKRDGCESPQRIVVDGRQGAVPDAVDQVLRMGLTNPRDPGDRLAILRMDQEVERFMRAPTSERLELGPLQTSYMRMAAHKVAQHYLLSTSSIMETGPDGAQQHKVVALKTPDSRLPSVQLSEIQMAQRSPRSQGPVKLATKPRNSGHHSNGESRQRQMGPLKSVEERNEEYQKARARIFNQEKEAAAQNGGLIRGAIGSPRSGMMGFPPEMAARTVQSPSENSSGRGGTGRGNNGEGGNGKRGKGPAIFRDREKEKRDPDFDRSRFNGRYDPAYGPQMVPYMPMFLPPQAAYSADFPPLGGPQPGMQGGMNMGEMAPQMQGSWMPAMINGPGGGQVYGSPGSPMQFPQGMQPFSPPGGQFMGPMSPQFSPNGQAFMSMAPFQQQQGGVYQQQFVAPRFPQQQQFPQNQFRGYAAVPMNAQQFNAGQFRPQFQMQPAQLQQVSPQQMNGQFQGAGNGQNFMPSGPPMYATQPYSMPGGVVYVTPEQFQAQQVEQFRPQPPPSQQLSPPPQQSQAPPRRR